MPLPIEISPAVQAANPVVDAKISVDVLIDAQAGQDALSYQLLAARRAELEDAETLRRVRAL